MKGPRRVCVLLPDRQRLDCAVGPKSRGRDVLANVQEQLGVGELQIFGLATLKDDEYLFIDLERTLSKYLSEGRRGGSEAGVSYLFLRVKYYMESGRLIQSRGELQLYYAALRQKVLRSLSRQQEAVLFQLAALALQAERRDLELQDPQCKHYFLPEDYFPSWLIKRRGRDYLLQHVPKLHGDLRGTTQRGAVLDFVGLSNALDDVPVTVYRMRRGKKERRCSIRFGIAAHGVRLYQDVEGRSCLLHELAWSDVERVTFQSSRLEVRAVGSRCLPGLVFHSPSGLHSALVLGHLRDSHRLTLSVRGALSHIRQMEETLALRSCREAYICDPTLLRQRLHRLTSSMTDSSSEPETRASGMNQDDEPHRGKEDLLVSESEEAFVDSPDDVLWLAELLFGISVDGPPEAPPSDWTAVTLEMTQVLERKSDTGTSVD